MKYFEASKESVDMIKRVDRQRKIIHPDLHVSVLWGETFDNWQDEIDYGLVTTMCIDGTMCLITTMRYEKMIRVLSEDKKEM